MTNVNKATVVFDLCPRCDSIWLDGGEIAEFLRPYGPPHTARSASVVLLDVLINLTAFLP